MKNWTKKIIISLATLCFAGAATAQLGGLGAALGGGAKGGGSVTAESLVKNYVSGAKNVLSADAKLLAAVGLKDQAANAELQAKNLTEGATASNLEDAAKVQTDSSKALSEKLDGKKVVLDAEGKKMFGRGVVDLVKGLSDYKKMSSDVSNFKPSLTSIGGAGEAAMVVVKTLPDNTTNLTATLKKVVDFAKENKIEVPQEATSLL